MDDADLAAMMEVDRPVWVLTTARAQELVRALDRANYDWVNGSDEELRAVIAKLWPDISFAMIEEGFRYAAYEDPVGIDPECDGLCVMGYDILGPEDGVPMDVLNSVAEPHPGCPLHAPDQVCGCGSPDRCMSPTHGKVTLQEALVVRYRQNPSDPRARG